MNFFNLQLAPNLPFMKNPLVLQPFSSHTLIIWLTRVWMYIYVAHILLCFQIIKVHFIFLIIFRIMWSFFAILYFISWSVTIHGHMRAAENAWFLLHTRNVLQESWRIEGNKMFQIKYQHACKILSLFSRVMYMNVSRLLFIVNENVSKLLYLMS